jgi:hypothetical protein
VYETPGPVVDLPQLPNPLGQPRRVEPELGKVPNDLIAYVGIVRRQCDLGSSIIFVGFTFTWLPRCRILNRLSKQLLATITLKNIANIVTALLLDLAR